MPRWGMGSRTWWRDWFQRSDTNPKGRDVPWGMDAGSKCHCPICPVGAWDRERGGGIGSNGAAPTRRDAMSLGAWMRDRNAFVPLAPTGPRQRDGTRYPLGVWMRNRKRKSRSCGVQERLECESWEAGQALLFSGFLSYLFGSFFGSFFSGSGLGFGAFFLDGGLGGGEAGDGHAVWAA